MLRDVMTAAAGVLGRIDVALVRGDARARALAVEFGFLVIDDVRNESGRGYRNGRQRGCASSTATIRRRRAGRHSAHH